MSLAVLVRDQSELTVALAPGGACVLNTMNCSPMRADSRDMEANKCKCKRKHGADVSLAIRCRTTPTLPCTTAKIILVYSNSECFVPLKFGAHFERRECPGEWGFG